MQYSRLGKSGMRVSRICLGMMSYGSPSWRQWVLTEEQGLPFVKKSIELGINYFDTADMYSQGVSEEVLGRYLKELKVPRDEVVIATKVYFPIGTDKAGNNKGLSRKHIMSAIDASLKRLGMDYVDLYQIHRYDPETPMEETMEALHDLVKSGKVRYIGASSMYAYQFAKYQNVAEKNGWTKFISMQNHYNMVYREEEREMNPYCNSEGVGLVPWSPLARGFLAGNRTVLDKEKAKELKQQQEKEKQMADDTKEKDSKKRKTEITSSSSSLTARQESDTFAHDMYYHDDDFKIVERVIELAKKRGKTAAQISLAWILHKPGVIAPIIGVTKMSQLEEAVDALSIKLSEEEMKYLEELYKPHRILGHT